MFIDIHRQYLPEIRGYSNYYCRREYLKFVFPKQNEKKISFLKYVKLCLNKIKIDQVMEHVMFSN